MRSLYIEMSVDKMFVDEMNVDGITNSKSECCDLES
jgi:hypothetical protein